MTRPTSATFILLVTSLLAVAWAVPGLAQPQVPEGLEVSSGVNAVDSLLSRFDDEGQLIGLVAVTLLFGAGIIGAALFGLAALVRAFRGDSLEIEEINERLAAIEAKLDSLAANKAAGTTAIQA